MPALRGLNRPGRRVAAREVQATAAHAAFKTTIKTTISASLKVACRHHGLCGPLLSASIATAAGIGIRNALVDWVTAAPATSPRHVTATTRRRQARPDVRLERTAG